MVSSRTVTALVGLLVSLGISVALWVAFDTVLFFLFVPFVPFLFRGLGGDSSEPRIVKECPQCGFQATVDAYDYCPRDGSRLESPSDDPDSW